MASVERRPFLGKGFKFPLQVTPKGALATASAEQRIEESILLILSTAHGERVMLPEFGCGLHDMVFAPNDPATVTLVVDHVRKSLVRFEPRVDVLDVSAKTSPEQPNVLLIHVDYRVRVNNAIGNLVYPFFITEGS